MKRMLWICVLVVMLTGCGAQETFETLGNAYQEPVAADAWQIEMDLPADAATPVMEDSDSGRLYLAENYTLVTQILASGDLNRTFQECTGFTKDSLDVMETEHNGWKRYEAVWTAAGEGGDQVGRIAVLDDGKYHYILTAMADAAVAGELTEVWQPVFRAFRIVEPGSLVNTGS